MTLDGAAAPGVLHRAPLDLLAVAARPADARPAEGTEATAATGRIGSIDVVKGVMLIVSVGVNSWVHMPAWFDHATWIGIHPLDWVFPTFVTLSGCGLAFANHRRVRLRPVVQRAVILFAVGLAYNWVDAGSPWPPAWATWRIPGVLQLYAVLVLVIAGLHTVVRGWRQWALLTTGLAVADAVLLRTWGTAVCAAGHVTPTCNPSHAVDFAVLGAPHLIMGGALGYDPEGVMGILGALVSASLGATVGHALLAGRGRLADPAGRLRTASHVAAVAAVAILLGNLLGIWVPGFKNQWTPPFALLVSGVAALALAAGHLAVDRPDASAVQRRVEWPLVALGRNSLFVYFGSHVLTGVLATHGIPPHRLWIDAFVRDVTVLGHPQASLTLLLLAVWVGLACLLHWRRIYLRP